MGKDNNTVRRPELQYVFVHGLSGWGSYDRVNRRVPYWGMFGGDLIRRLNRKGYACYAASVGGETSAWDRACELYAQLAGTRTDYGKAHSGRCHHDRYGRDFTGQPLVPDWGDGKKIVLLGHSFGGATIRLFSEILAHGDKAELEADPEGVSPFFRGGQGERIFALVTLAAPTNGTTAYDLYEDPDFDPQAVKVPRADERWGNWFDARPSMKPDGRIREDYAGYDMHIDNALELNRRISTLPYVYYFAVPCKATEEAQDGSQRPVRKKMEGMFRRASARMGSYTGKTAGGFVIDASWQANDGLVNTVSAMAPLGAPYRAYDPASVGKGIWNILPVYQGDHMSLQGGMTVRHDIRPFYFDLLEKIDALPE